ncbi:hypothetical protein B4N89_27260 [Embleya scabrispora]|uniref:Uncharacterized protein n=1 Tax=Embleya scabrispora TaxID=159449 RepID=A0A1T3P5G9_9ACTN|nr:hypothetical protein [Embleya scabrispora]OPC84130.1 hypothetical protein B4N89_27260 [Embleya scabrispora]
MAGVDVIVDTTHPVYVIWVLESRIGANAAEFAAEIEQQLNSRNRINDIAEIVRFVSTALSTMAS